MGFFKKYISSFRKKIITFCLLGLLSFLCSLDGQIEYLGNPYICVWSENYVLTIDDFQAQKYTGTSLSTNYTERKNAYISCNLDIKAISQSGFVDILVLPYFNRAQSWIDTSGLGQEQIKHLLIHEKGHFAITEYVCRFMRSKIDSLTKNNALSFESYSSTVSESKELFSQINYEYDNYTIHGSNLNFQHEWDSVFAVKSMLLNKYSSDYFEKDNYYLRNCTLKE